VQKFCLETLFDDRAELYTEIKAASGISQDKTGRS
jgi:hypothetical protein